MTGIAELLQPLLDAGRTAPTVEELSRRVRTRRRRRRAARSA